MTDEKSTVIHIEAERLPSGEIAWPIWASAAVVRAFGPRVFDKPWPGTAHIFDEIAAAQPKEAKPSFRKPSEFTDTTPTPGAE